MKNNTAQTRWPQPGEQPVSRTAGTTRRSPSPATRDGEKRRNTINAAAPRGTLPGAIGNFSPLPAACRHPAASQRLQPRPEQQQHPSPPERCLHPAAGPLPRAAPPLPTSAARWHGEPPCCRRCRCGSRFFPLSPPPRYGRRLCPEPDTERN